MNRHAAVTILWILFASVLAASPSEAGSGGGACETLQRVMAAAENAEGIAAITGEDAGLYHETQIQLPGADFCASYPTDGGSGTWRCLIASEGKYSIALQTMARHLKKTTECLGDGWTATVTRSSAYLREVILDNDDSAARLRLLVTQGVEPVKGWREHRIVLIVEFSRAALPVD